MEKTEIPTINVAELSQSSTWLIVYPQS